MQSIMQKSFVQIQGHYRKLVSRLYNCVPLFRKKEKKRGYNQAQVLAKHIGKELAIPVEKNIVARIRNTVPQKKLNDTEMNRKI